MKASTRFSTFAFLSVGLVSILAQAHVHLPFSRQVRDLSSVLVGRDSNPSLPLWGRDYVYVVNATVGTPGQKVALVLSPSTADTWVPDAASPYCNYTSYDSYYDDNDVYHYNYTYSSYCLWGSFDKSNSSTYQRANQAYREWSAYTSDATFMSGSNFTDTLKIGDVTVENLPMGLATSSDQWIGMLGLGSNYSYRSDTYDNLPDRLVKAGTIATKAYSIWLDAEDGSSGSLLMGAVDTSKYDGTLTRVDADYSAGMYGSFGVYVNAINGSSSSSAAAEVFTSNELPFNAVIGPGETFSNLPDPIAQKIWSMAGATYNSTILLATIPCDAADKATDGGAHFTFELVGAKGPTISVPLADLILPQTVAAKRWGFDSYYSDESPSSAPPNTCLFAVQNASLWYTTNGGSSSSSTSSYETYNVGAALLRRSYMVFDTVNRELAIAPVKFGSTAASNIVAFQNYGATAPSATAFCADPSSCRSGGSSTSGSGSGSGSSGSGSSGSGSVNIGLVAGLSVAFGLVTIVALVGGFLVWRKSLRKKSAKEVEGDALLGNAVAVDRTPVVPGGQGPPPSSPLPPIREDMAEVPREQAPQLPVASPVTEQEHGAAGARWPLQDGSSSLETPSPEVQHGLTEETQQVVGKGKGKAPAAHDDH
ncbi:Acid protease [Coniochaeta hoffmannii]|uniref:Acid protease n=1 Tax=Coniochaeta hoffmannii TaxID=91930 RepID=A0AA38SHK3_9PEZI|nr:Acid protease [Coniochaeta hoffmannii]